MRPNGHGIRHLKSRPYKGSILYFWNPPKIAAGMRTFRWRTIGTDLAEAVRVTQKLNLKLEKFIKSKYGERERLTKVRPKSSAWLARQFEASPKFLRYAKSTQLEYSRLYRQTEIFKYDGKRWFGDLPFNKVTEQIAYAMYENATDGVQKVRTAAMIVTAWQAAFNYANRRIAHSGFNPFSQLGMYPLRPRIQRWSDDELDSFLSEATRAGQHSISLFVLMCMELMQRPCDIRALRWESLLHVPGFIRIVQSKRGAEVLIPPTNRLRRELRKAFRRTGAKSILEIRDAYICPTKTGKKWQKRNIARDAREIARTAGIPDTLQLRDLRRTAATEAASAGATAWELMATGGWQNPASIRPYLVRTPGQTSSIQAKREAFRKDQKKPTQMTIW